jgi:hypothetical protein
MHFSCVRQTFGCDGKLLSREHFKLCLLSRVNSSTLAQVWLERRPFYKTVPLVILKQKSLDLRNLGTDYSRFATAGVKEA